MDKSIKKEIFDYKLPRMLRFKSCWTVPIELTALIVTTPLWRAGLVFGIVKVYLLLLTSFSIWTASLDVNSLPLISQLIAGLGVPSTTHSNLTNSSLFTGPGWSGTLTKIGAPRNFN